MAEATAFLKPLTPEAAACLGTALYQIPHFPFRVGRESRSRPALSFPNSRRRMETGSNNDLYLRDGDERMNISREHFEIERCGDAFFLVDRNSMCGTIVEGETVGKGRNGGKRQLQNGDVIIVGTSGSRQIIKFVTRNGADQPR